VILCLQLHESISIDFNTVDEVLWKCND